MKRKTCEPDSKSVCGDTVWVRVPPPAPRVATRIAVGRSGPQNRWRSAIFRIFGAFAIIAAPMASAEPDPIPFVQVAAVNGACTVPYDLQDGAELHVHCYTVAIVVDPVAVVETGAPAVSATLVRTFRKPAGAWVVLRGAANGTARIVLLDAAKFRRPVLATNAAASAR